MKKTTRTLKLTIGHDLEPAELDRALSHAVEDLSRSLVGTRPVDGRMVYSVSLDGSDAAEKP